MEQRKEEELECAVCLQPCIHPVKLPCSHIFCFLCVKGVANQSKRCAMCRQEIPPDYLDNPDLLKEIKGKEAETEGYQWFYEGRNGWWQYDERTSGDLENSYNGGQRVCEVLVAGFLYTIDFDRMLQHRRNDPSRRRRIKRDLASIPKKGIAGLKTSEENVQEESSSCENLDLHCHLQTETNVLEGSFQVENISSNDPLSAHNNSEDVTASENSNASEPLEILQGHSSTSSLHSTRRDTAQSSVSVNLQNFPLLRNRGLRSREQLPSVSNTERNIQCRLRQIRNENSSFNSRDHPVSVDDLAISLVDLTVDEEEDTQCYSLDETEEYRLPNEEDF